MSKGVSSGGSSGISALQPALLGVGITMAAGIASALSGLAGLLPAGGLGALTGVGTLMVGLDGVKDAYDAVTKAAKTSDQDQAEQAQKVTSATQSLRDAVASESQAQRDVANARKDARQQLEDLNLQLRGGALSEADAVLQARKAREDLATGTYKTVTDYQIAQLRVQEADQRVAESHQRNIELSRKANDERAKGVDGADNVVAANERLTKSHEEVQRATTALDFATKGMSSSAKDAAQAMAQLSPAGQALVNTLVGMKPAFTDFKNTVQDALLKGLGPVIQQLSGTYLPMLKDVMSQMATTMNQEFGSLAQLFQKPEMVAGIRTMFANINTAFTQFMPTINTLVQAFTQMSIVGSGFLPQFGQIVNQMAQAFSNFVNSGDFAKWIQTGMDALRQLMPVLGSLGRIFLDLAPIGSASLGAIGTLLTALEPAIRPLVTAFAALVTALSPALGFIGQIVTVVISSFAPALTMWLNALSPVIQQMAGVFQPVLQALAPVLQQVAASLANSMVQGIQTLLPVLVPFVAQMGQLLIAVLPLLPQLVNLAISALPVVEQALALVLPLMTKWATMCTDLATIVIPPLTKVVETMGKMFGTQFNAVKSVVGTVWDFVRPILEKMKSLLDDIAKPLSVVGNLLFGGAPSDEATAKLNAARAQVGLPPIAPTAVGGATIAKGPGGSIIPIGPTFTGLPTGAPAGGIGSSAFQPNRGGWSPAPGQFATVPPVSSYAAPGVAPSGNIYNGPHTENTHGAIVPNNANLEAAIKQMFPQIKDIGGYRQPDGYNEHSSGEASDIMIPDWNTPQGKALGDQIDQWLLSNSSQFGIQYTLWQQAQHNPDGSVSPMSNRGSPNDNHMTHIHARVKPGAASGSTDALAPAYANATPPSGAPMPTGGPTDPMYVALSPNIPAGQQAGGQGQDLGQLGQKLGPDLLQLGGFDGSVFGDPTQYGITKFLGGLINGLTGIKMPAGGGAGGFSGFGGGGGGGGSAGGLGGLLGMIPNIVGPNSFASMAQGPPGAPGPGNDGTGYNNAGGIDLRGANLGVDPAGFNNTLQSVTASQNRYNPLLRSVN